MQLGDICAHLSRLHAPEKGTNQRQITTRIAIPQLSLRSTQMCQSDNLSPCFGGKCQKFWGHLVCALQRTDFGRDLGC